MSSGSTVINWRSAYESPESKDPSIRSSRVLASSTSDPGRRAVGDELVHVEEDRRFDAQGRSGHFGHPGQEGAGLEGLRAEALGVFGVRREGGDAAFEGFTRDV